MPVVLSAAALSMSRTDFRTYANKALAVAALITSLTPTPKDDAGVELLSALVKDDVQFARVCDILGLAAEGALADPDAPIRM